MNISIVIPVYNAEEYLSKCLDSVCAQDACVQEIVLVNDGSTDGSLGICKNYAERDKRINILDRENTGTEQAIIDGVNATTCEYIGFVDSDDYVEPDMFRIMADSVESTNAEVVICSYNYVNMDGQVSVAKDLGFGGGGLNIKENGKFRFQILPTLRDDRFIAAARWNKLIKRELIINNAFFKTHGLRVGEDLALIIPVIMSAKSVMLLDKCMYHYVLRGGSLSRSYGKHNLSDWEKSIEILKSASENYGYQFENFGDSALTLLLSNCLVPLRRSDIPRAQKKQEYKIIGNNSLVRQFLHEVKIKATFKKKIIFKLLKYKLYGLLSLVYK